MTYGSLWLISKGYFSEVRDFRSTVEYDIDVASIKDGVIYLRTYLKNYDLEEISNDVNPVKLDRIRPPISYSFVQS